MPTKSPVRFKMANRRYNRLKQTHPSLSSHPTEIILTNAEARQPNDLYQQMFERNRAVKLIINPENGQIIDANQAACNYYGYTRDQIKALRISDINTLSESEVHDIMQHSIAEKGATYQFRHRLASGAIRDVEVFTGLLEVINTKYLYAIVQDITERKQAEKALRESEALYRLFARNMPDSSVIMFDSEMRYTLAEGSFLEKFGLVYSNIVGKTPQEVLPTESLNFLLPMYKRILKGEIFSYERITDVFAYESYATPIRDDNGQIIGGMILSHDTTKAKRLEEELRSSEERLRIVMDNIQDLVTQSDAEDRIMFVSQSSELILGLEPEAIIGRFRHEFVNPNDWDRMVAGRQMAIDEHRDRLHVEGRLRHSDGHFVDIETVGKLFYDSQSNYSGAVFLTRDITQRNILHNLELEKEKLQTALDKELELSTLKTRMMERIAHEFRTPLAVIQIATETLSLYYERLSSDQKAAKGFLIKTQIDRITDMLDQIGLVIKGMFTLDHMRYSPIDLGDLCREVIDNLSTISNLPEKYVLNVLETSVVPVDRSLIKNALMHIMQNATRFSPLSAPVIVTISKAEDSIEVRVTDTGIGIIPTELPRIFEPFFRGSNIDESSGLGVGLTIARAAVEAHGGTITVESESGKGTTVSIWIPVS